MDDNWNKTLENVDCLEIVRISNNKLACIFEIYEKNYFLHLHNTLYLKKYFAHAF